MQSGQGLLRLLLFAAWIGIVVYGFNQILRYNSTPGVMSRASAVWPKTSRIPHPSDVPVLLMLAHPQCPCTRASFAEFERLMPHVQGQVKAYILFVKPKGFAEEQLYGDLWKKAQKIPGIEIILDLKGEEAAAFGARTSGEMLLYDREGRLIFNGGITSARGHEGDNIGRQTITDLILRGKSTRKQSAIFGCSLFDPQARKGI